ncbi:TcpQ domain-containing protein [Pantoea ananatis]|uniref:TcpQ domain-containing protein n=1 Tax=Pantoea ananas TaxID=553 RepID=UPI001B30C93A|nr:TcpQ domain-containing protein [Pantoea ananatis]
MSLTERAGLLTALLLTGCASPTVISGPPSGNVVDGLLTRSASDISAMQYRVYQTGPTAKRPVSASSVRINAALSPRPLSASTATQSHLPKPVTPAVSDTAATGGFIRQRGAAPTLRAALRKIVPTGQTVIFAPEVKPDTPELWQWTGNDRWPYVVNRMLADRGLRATFSEKTHSITIAPDHKGQSVKAVSPVPDTNKGIPVLPNVAAKHATGRDPFSADRNMTPLSSKTVKTMPPVQAPVPAIPVRTWRVEKGTTLREGFTLWAGAEQCGPHKMWQVRWDATANYPIDYALSFTATNFEEATRQLFALWKTARVPLFVDGYGAPQCLIVVHDSRGM